MNLLVRDRDVFFGKNDLENLYVFKNFPVYMGVTDSESSQDLFADMVWGISRGSGMLQLLKLVPEDVLYKHSHNGSVGRLWREHHTKFADFIYENIGSNGTGNIIEIGGGNGILNSIFIKKYDAGNYIIVEPSSVKPVEGCNAKYIRKAWGVGTIEAENFPKTACLVHSHVLEHLYDINNFMLQCERLLSAGQKMIFSVPNLKETLRRQYTNALNFEHTYFISEDYIEEILNRHAFRIFNKQYYKEDHSIFYAAEKGDVRNRNSSIDFKFLYEQNKKIFKGFIENHQKLIHDFNKRMEKADSNIYLFGAHIFSQYLINFGLDVSKIQCVLDNDAMKQGKRLYGTELTVKSPEILREETKPIVILRTANYAEEIKQDIIKNINPDVVFWEK